MSSLWICAGTCQDMDSSHVLTVHVFLKSLEESMYYRQTTSLQNCIFIQYLGECEVLRKCIQSDILIPQWDLLLIYELNVNMDKIRPMIFSNSADAV